MCAAVVVLIHGCSTSTINTGPTPAELTARLDALALQLEAIERAQRKWESKGSTTAARPEARIGMEARYVDALEERRIQIHLEMEEIKQHIKEERR